MSPAVLEGLSVCPDAVVCSDYYVRVIKTEYVCVREDV